jgi:hypothetical protein
LTEGLCDAVPSARRKLSLPASDFVRHPLKLAQRHITKARTAWSSLSRSVAMVRARTLGAWRSR